MKLVERHEQRPVKASALLCLGAERTAKKTIIKGSRFAACSIVAPLRCMPANRELALEQQREKIRIEYNHLGSPIEVRATMGGLPVLSCKYDSFGNIIEQNGDFELPFRFAGGIWDEDTKLIRFGVRDYDPETGRWTSVEPLGFAGSRNWYVYAGNDGVNYLDLDGLRYTDYGGQNGNSGYGPNWGKLGKSLFKDFPIVKKLISNFLLILLRRLGITLDLALNMKEDSCPDDPCKGMGRFPEDYNDFYPENTYRRDYKDSKIIKWHDNDTKKSRYEWNYRHIPSQLDHYHKNPADGKGRIRHPITGDTHIYPGDCYF